MKTVRGSYLFLTALSFLTLPFLSCSAPRSRVTAYTTLDEELARSLLESFEEETGIEVSWIRLSTGECVARLETEKSRPRASLWLGGVGLGHIEAKNKGLTEPYRSPLADMEPPFRDEEYYWTGLYAGTLSIQSNADRLVKFGLPVPSRWEHLTDPSYKGHIQMSNPGTSGTANNIVATLVQLWGEEKAFEYMEDLNSNITHYSRSGMAPVRRMSLGEVSIAIGYSHDALRLKKEGYPVIISYPEEGTGYEIASLSMIRNGPKKEREAARRLYDWMLGEKAARILASSYIIPLSGFPEGEDLPDGVIPLNQIRLIEQRNQWAAENKQRLVELWNARIDNEK